MDKHLLGLLEYRDVLSAVAATWDGLVIAAAGLTGEDAEVVAAAGSALVGALGQEAGGSSALDIAGGAVHVATGEELMLVALTEASVPAELLAPVMRETLDRLDLAIREGDAEG